MNRAVFLDRDGVISENNDNGTLSWEDFHFLPNTFQGLEKLQKLCLKLVVFTNQSKIGKGKVTRKEVEAINNKMKSQLEELDIHLDAIYMCPHTDKDNCVCRKPNTGMLNKAVADLDINLKQSFVIGDSTCDILAGNRAGCKSILVLTGHAGKDNKHQCKPNFIADDLLEAARIIQKELNRN
ncbi:MAG: HAD family hydrolase [Candidatus Aenigmatarchaeota archaeon]